MWNYNRQNKKSDTNIDQNEQEQEYPKNMDNITI
jgi:hypothetical protein